MLKGVVLSVGAAGESNYKFGLKVVLAERFRAAAFLFLEKAVEVRDVVESAFKTNLGAGHGAVDEAAGGVAYSDVYDIVRKGAPGARPEETAEGRGGHSNHVGKLVEIERFRIVGVDIVLNFLDPAGVARHSRVGERRA